jgi:hypothetical protein
LIKQLAALAVELNPTATLVPAGTTDPNKSVAEELESIRELRRNDPNKYEPTTRSIAGPRTRIAGRATESAEAFAA